MSSESSFNDDFDDLSSLFVGLVPDLANRVLAGVPGVRDDGRNDSSVSFERLTIFLDTGHTTVPFRLYIDYSVPRWRPRVVGRISERKRRRAGKSVNTRGRGISCTRTKNDRDDVYSNYRAFRLFWV